MLETAKLYVREGTSPDDATADTLPDIPDHLTTTWQKTDAGIWALPDAEHNTACRPTTSTGRDRPLRLLARGGAGGGGAPAGGAENDDAGGRARQRRRPVRGGDRPKDGRFPGKFPARTQPLGADQRGGGDSSRGRGLVGQLSSLRATRRRAAVSTSQSVREYPPLEHVRRAPRGSGPRAGWLGVGGLRCPSTPRALSALLRSRW